MHIRWGATFGQSAVVIEGRLLTYSVDKLLLPTAAQKIAGRLRLLLQGFLPSTIFFLKGSFWRSERV
jgi:hypothetical protein